MPQSCDSSSDSDVDDAELEKIKDAVCGTRNITLSLLICKTAIWGNPAE